MLSCAAEQFYSPSYLIRTLKTSIRLSLSFSNRLANGGERCGEQRGKNRQLKDGGTDQTRTWTQHLSDFRLHRPLNWVKEARKKQGKKKNERALLLLLLPPRRGLRLNGGKPPSISKASSIFTLAVEGCGWSKERVLLFNPNSQIDGGVPLCCQLARARACARGYGRAEAHTAAVETVQAGFTAANPVRNVFEWRFPLEEHFLIRAIFRVDPVLR